ncbi:unnamed protein product, partial [Mesorhabditis belari]|uniref:Sodium/hydrogen exchanger n=1 Tax=Mesorhabditis belari TaxID=2138241 RepID=A0AAF3ERX5_9BILA
MPSVVGSVRAEDPSSSAQYTALPLIGSSELENDTVAQPKDFEPIHDPAHQGSFFHFDETGAPLSILAVILMIGFLKAALIKSKRIPHSVLLLVFGSLAGFVLTLVFSNDIYLRPQWFFYYMLPPIVLEAGYFLKNKDFFHNIGTITLFAVVGTILNTAMIAGLLYLSRGWFKTIDLSFVEITLFSVLICAVDPVAVLCVFEDIHVNELLYICVFGESLLNDAVTIVLFNTISTLVPGGSDAAQANEIHIGPYECANAVWHFFRVSFGGIGCGIIGGYITVVFMRLLVTFQIAQPINLIACPIVCYLMTESMHLSAILSIVVIGILMKNYMPGNVTDPMIFTVEYLLKMGSSYSESLVFVFLGVSLISSNHHFDIPFISLTLVGCLVFRFLGVYLLCFIANRFRSEQERICFEDQFVMAYGGIRGAVCYGLVMAIDEKAFPAKGMFVTTTLIVIVFTTIIQGSTIKFLVEMLQVKRSRNYGKESEKKRVIDYFFGETNKQLMFFIEDLIAHHGQNYFFRKFLEKDRVYIKPLLIANYRQLEADIVVQHQRMEIDEYACNIKGQGGSFAGLPTVSSLADMAHHPGLPKSKSEAILLPRVHDTIHDAFSPEPTERSNLLPVPPPSQRSIPRNESLSGFVREAFETAAQKQGRGSLRDKDFDYGMDGRRNFRQRRRSLYSRHLLDLDFCEDDKSEATPIKPKESAPLGDEFDNNLTYPANKFTSLKVAKQMRNYGKSLKERGGAVSPRAFLRGRPSAKDQLQSSARDTSPPKPAGAISRPRLSLPTPDEIQLKRKPPKISFAMYDETIPPIDQTAPPTARQGRKVSTGRKVFVVGGDERDLNPIREEPSFLSPDYPPPPVPSTSKKPGKRERTTSSNN